MGRISLDLDDASALRELAGELGRNLKILGRAYSVQISQRGQVLTLFGHAALVRQAADALAQLYDVARAGFPLSGVDVDQACRVLRGNEGVRLVDLFRDVVKIGAGRKDVHPRSVRQRAYIQAIRDHDLVFGLGPAGTGKTYLAMAMALAALFRQDVRRIILCRPAVEAGEKLGFLPGDMAEKINPYLRPLYDALHDLLGAERSQRLMHKEVIEVAPLAFMRGRTLSDAFVILDEAQNTTPEQMKMLLTRTGMNSQVVVTGDPSQVDLDGRQCSGLEQAVRILSDVDGIATVRFTEADVVRHPLVSSIILAYDRHAPRVGRDADSARARQLARSPGPDSPQEAPDVD
ncbi:MAG: PhoH family protein [Oligoflexia bacterium]|nr:PhoH family protein [Oligoflexia bacterium]